MKSIWLLVFILNLGCQSTQPEKVEDKTNPITTYYLVRHAEKERSNPDDKNPNLTTEGLNRAENWKQILSNLVFDSVFTTNYNRTQQTILPLANYNKLTPKFYDAENLITQDFLEATKGKTIFIVGHSNTIPEMVNKLIGENKYQEINDAENGSLFIVTIIGSEVSEQLLIIN